MSEGSDMQSLSCSENPEKQESKTRAPPAITANPQDPEGRRRRRRGSVLQLKVHTSSSITRKSLVSDRQQLLKV